MTCFVKYLYGTRVLLNLEDWPAENFGNYKDSCQIGVIVLDERGLSPPRLQLFVGLHGRDPPSDVL